MSDLKKRLQAGEKVLGTMVSIFDNPEIARILKNCGLDWFFFDTEHGYVNADRLYGVFAYARMCGIAALIRIPEINKTEVFRALDMGAAGIVCPNVESAAEAKELVRLAKYAPLGQRGVSLTRPHTGYQKVSAPEYMKRANEETIVVCQIESVRGVENIREIIAVEGVDGVLVGPNDLTSSMGIINSLDDPDYIAKVDAVLAACKEAGKFAGISGKDLEALKRWQEKGMQLNQWGTDVSLLMNAIRAGLGR